MGSPLGAHPMFKSNIYGKVTQVTFKFTLTKNTLMYMNFLDGKQTLILEFE